MRHIRSLLIVIFLLIAGCYFILQFNNYINIGDTTTKLNEIADLPKLKSNQENKQMKDMLTGDLFDLMNQSSGDVIDQYGAPTRKDLSAYGYEWWIYDNGYDEYIQFGIEDHTVRTIFGTGNNLPS